MSPCFSLQLYLMMANDGQVSRVLFNGGPLISARWGFGESAGVVSIETTVP
jgi:hypothetical protein